MKTDCWLDICSHTNAEHTYISAVSWQFAVVFVVISSATHQRIRGGKCQPASALILCGQLGVRTSYYCSLFRRGWIFLTIIYDRMRPSCYQLHTIIFSDQVLLDQVQMASGGCCCGKVILTWTEITFYDDIPNVHGISASFQLFMYLTFSPFSNNIATVALIRIQMVEGQAKYSIILLKF